MVFKRRGCLFLAVWSDPEWTLRHITKTLAISHARPFGSKAMRSRSGKIRSKTLFFCSISRWVEFKSSTEVQHKDKLCCWSSNENEEEATRHRLHWEVSQCALRDRTTTLAKFSVRSFINEVTRSLEANLVPPNEQRNIFLAYYHDEDSGVQAYHRSKNSNKQSHLIKSLKDLLML